MKERKYLFLLAGVFLLVIVGSVIKVNFSKNTSQIEKKFVTEIKDGSESLPSPNLGVNLPPLPDQALIRIPKIVHQTFNNCGPATLSMALSFYGINKSQKELGEEMRPYQHPRGNNDDKTVFPEEFITLAENFNLKATYRPAGSLQLIKLLTSNGIPVILKTWLRPKDDIGHYTIIVGFDEKKKLVVAHDSYYGKGRKISYYQLLELWQPFNYGYIIVYLPEKEVLVKAILAEEWETKIAYEGAIERAEKERRLDPNNIYPVFNLSTSYYYLDQPEESVKYFEQVEEKLPRRMFWYQIEPILTYQRLKNYDRVFQISDWLFTNGNRAFSELYQIRGKIYLEKGNKETARKEFELALKYNKNFQPAKEALLNL